MGRGKTIKHLKEYIQELQDEQKWNESFNKSHYFLSINTNIDEKIFHRELSFCRVYNEWFDYEIKSDNESFDYKELSKNILSSTLSFYSQNERLARVIFKTYQKEIVHEFLKCDDYYYYKILSLSDNQKKDEVSQKYLNESRLLYVFCIFYFKVLILASIEKNKLRNLIDFIEHELPYYNYIVNLPSADLELHTFKDVLSDKIWEQARLYRES